MNKELESFLKDYLANNGGKLKADKLYDEIKKEFPNSSNTEINKIVIDLLIDGDLSHCSKARKWLEKCEKAYRKGESCGFASLNKYFDAIAIKGKGEEMEAYEALEEAKEMMNNEAASGCPFVKDLFEDIIDEGFDD